MRIAGSHEGDHFDLLPFIAVMMSTLGCLLLITLSIAALYLGPSANEGWIPASTSEKISKMAVLVEWDGTAAVIHMDHRKMVGRFSARSGADEALNQALSSLVERRGTHYALIAVRPSGFATFTGFSREFRSRQIDIGSEPISQERSVRLLNTAIGASQPR